MSATPAPFLRAIPLPRKYMKPGVNKLEVTEYALRSRRMPDGYWITLGAIVIPSSDRTIFGASACSPDDELLFSRSDAANRAMGRARQVAFRVWAGLLPPGISPESQQPTLLGVELDGVFATPLNHNLDAIQQLAEPLFHKVWAYAYTMAAIHEQKILNRRDPHFNWSFVPRQEVPPSA